MLIEEIWVKMSNAHLVSNLGRIYSYYTNSIIGTFDVAYGRNVVLHNKQTTPIHVLIAKAFPEICGYWFDGCVVHHKNHNKNDNRAVNLQILTRDEHNKIHHTGVKRSKKTCENISNSLIGKGIGHKNPNAKAILQLSENGDLIKEWPCYIDCCEELGLSVGALRTKFSQEQSDLIHLKGYILKRINH